MRTSYRKVGRSFPVSEFLSPGDNIFDFASYLLHSRGISTAGKNPTNYKLLQYAGMLKGSNTVYFNAQPYHAPAAALADWQASFLRYLTGVGSKVTVTNHPLDQEESVPPAKSEITDSKPSSIFLHDTLLTFSLEPRHNSFNSSAPFDNALHQSGFLLRLVLPDYHTNPRKSSEIQTGRRLSSQRFLPSKWEPFVLKTGKSTAVLLRTFYELGKISGDHI